MEQSISLSQARYLQFGMAFAGWGLPMRSLLLALILVPLLSSCFENIEEIRLKADGSGSFTYTINFSQIKGEISSALRLDSFLGLNLPSLEEVKSKVRTVRDKLLQSPGISNVVLKEDYDNFILELSGNFTSIDKLNAAAKNISIAMGGNPQRINDGFSYSGTDSSFSRNIYSIWKPEVVEKIRRAAGTRLANSTYRLIVKSEKPAKKVNNSRAKISPSGKAVMLQLSGNDLLTNPQAMDIFIGY